MPPRLDGPGGIFVKKFPFRIKNSRFWEFRETYFFRSVDPKLLPFGNFPLCSF